MAGVVTMGIGTVFSEIAVGISTFGGKMLMEGARAATHGYMGIVTSGGENLGRSFLTAAASSLMASGVGALNINNPLAQTAISSLTGGVTSVIGGGSFIEGAARGLVVGLLNHVWHQSTRKPNDYDGFNPMYFENQDAAFEYMWTTSNSAQVELSAWMLADGSVIVLPYHENTINESNNNYLKVTKNTKTGERFVRFQGEKRLIKSHIHTHILDGRQGNPIGISEFDFDFQQKMGFPIYIMHNANIYKYDNNKYYYQKSLY